MPLQNSPDQIHKVGFRKKSSSWATPVALALIVLSVTAGLTIAYALSRTPVASSPPPSHSTSQQRTLQLVELEGSFRMSSRGSAFQVLQSLAVSPDGGLVVAVGMDDGPNATGEGAYVRLWSTKLGQLIANHAVSDIEAAPRLPITMTVKFSEGGNYIVLRTGSGKWWVSPTHTLLFRELAGPTLNSVCWDLDDKHIFLLWHLDGGREFKVTRTRFEAANASVAEPDATEIIRGERAYGYRGRYLSKCLTVSHDGKKLLCFSGPQHEPGPVVVLDAEQLKIADIHYFRSQWGVRVYAIRPGQDQALVKDVLVPGMAFRESFVDLVSGHIDKWLFAEPESSSNWHVDMSGHNEDTLERAFTTAGWLGNTIYTVGHDLRFYDSVDRKLELVESLAAEVDAEVASSRNGSVLVFATKVVKHPLASAKLSFARKQDE